MKLETQRLILRDWRKSDVKDLVEGLNNLKVTRWLVQVKYPYTKKDAEEWINRCNKNASKGKNRNSYQFAIELKSNKKVIGGTDLRDIDRFNGTGLGGIWLNATYHKNGYGTEAYEARIRFAFTKLGLRRIESGFLKGNSPSSRMHKKLGFKPEGLRREKFKSRADGKLKDEYITALLKEDWKNKE